MSYKYFKTPEVGCSDSEGNLYVKCGCAIIDTSKLTEEECRIIMFFCTKIGMHKCTEIEVREKEIPTPCGVVRYEPSLIVDEPRNVKETSFGVYDIDGIIYDLNSSPEELYEILYGE